MKSGIIHDFQGLLVGVLLCFLTLKEERVPFHRGLIRLVLKALFPVQTQAVKYFKEINTFLYWNNMLQC